MKKIFYMIFTLLIILFFFGGCKSEEETNLPSQEETQQEAKKEYTLNLSELQFTPWDENTFSYDEKTNKLIISTIFSGGQVGIDYKNTDPFNYFYIEYESNYSFQINLVYSDSSIKETILSPFENKKIIDLDSSKLNEGLLIQIMSLHKPITVDLKMIKFITETPDKFDEDIEQTIIDSAKVGKFDDSLSAMELAKKMKMGWNLGNTLDAYDKETFTFGSYPYDEGLISQCKWGESITTKKIIETGYQYGYKTIRIPVTWFNHIIDEDYTINPQWMNYVKKIVDWAIDTGYYVILNEHHSVRDNMNDILQTGEGYTLSTTDKEESKKFLVNIWTQICATFNNSYDEHLIFETINEPRNTKHDHCWDPKPDTCNECEENINILNEYNQLILDTIRKSGGNNAKRFVIIPPICTRMDFGHREDINFKLPTDTAADKLLVTVHDYPLGTGEEGSPVKEFSEEIKYRMTYDLDMLNEKWCKKGIPVIIGETGVPRIIDGKNNNKDLYESMKHYATISGKYSMPMIFWDAGGLNTIDRDNCKPFDLEFVDTVVSAWNNIN